jgi:hypothetical protein
MDWRSRPVRLTYQPPASSTFLSEQTSQQYFSLRTNQHQSSATSQTNRMLCHQLQLHSMLQSKTTPKDPNVLFEEVISQILLNSCCIHVIRTPNPQYQWIAYLSYVLLREASADSSPLTIHFEQRQRLIVVTPWNFQFQDVNRKKKLKQRFSLNFKILPSFYFLYREYSIEKKSFVWFSKLNKSCVLHSCRCIVFGCLDSVWIQICLLVLERI